LAALFPGLSRWIYGNGHGLSPLDSNLELLDRFARDGAPPSPAFFLAGLFGPVIEETALAQRRDARARQALEDACGLFVKEITGSVSIPNRVSGRMRAIVALQPSLTRKRPKRPAAIAARSEFSESMAYLRLAVEAGRAPRAALEFWEDFLAGAPQTAGASSPTGEPSAKGRRKRRRKHRLFRRKDGTGKAT
jgi:hypothetical protein